MGDVEIINRLLEQTTHLVRQAWAPVLAEEPSSYSRPQATRFGGTRPFRWPGFSWPKCSECDCQKAFVCQIEGQSLPAAARALTKLEKDAILQVFFCLDCLPFEGVLEGIYILRGSSPVQTLQDSAGKALVENKISFAHLPEKLKKRVEAFTEPWEAERDALKEVEVVGWQEKGPEIPSRTELQERWQEVRQEGSDLDLEEALDLDVDELPGPVSWPRSRVKVGGWVRWCQGVEYPSCPQCKILMTVPLLQLEGDEKVHNFSWGDAGTAHLTLCPSCHRAALGWACC